MWNTRRFERFRFGFALLVGCAWAGSLWTVGFVVAPSLFAALGPEHQKLAGDLAGGFFRFEMLFSVGCAAMILLLRMEWAVMQSRTARWTSWMLLLAIVTSVGIIPVVTELRAALVLDPSVAPQFARWHAVSSVFYAVMAVSAVPLVLSLAVDFGRVLFPAPTLKAGLLS